jgi:hypothetical protein
MAIKYIAIFFNLGRSKIYPDWDFWFEKKPSGNPGWKADVLPAIKNKNKGTKKLHEKNSTHQGIVYCQAAAFEI